MFIILYKAEFARNYLGIIISIPTVKRISGVTKNMQTMLDAGTDASINVALSQSESLKVAFPVIQVINKKGDWDPEFPGYNRFRISRGSQGYTD